MPNIDERVVQMTFDNKQFESGVSESLKTLDDLKEALNFNGVEKSLKTIENAFSGVDLSGLSNAIESVADHFSPLGILAVTTMQRISNAAIDTGKKVADAFFGISDMSAGQSKYETYTKAVQTITNATGQSVAEVEQVLKKLQTYTDETSYDFSEMVASIGKFTSSGVDLEKAEGAMEGIANWAAKSGAGISEANRAMYNLSQSLATGSVKLIDWKSIENANMATKEFKETAIQTAIELGVLQDKGNGIGSIVTTNEEKLKKATAQLEKAKKATKDRSEKMAAAQEKVNAATKETDVTFTNFNQTLSEGWLTSDVLLATLEKYSNTADPFGAKAYEAAQKALTFTDAIQAVKDALSSGWMDTYKYLFGNLDEAMDLWTGVSNALYDYIAIFRDWRNEVLKGWHEGLGYNDMIEAASNLWQTFMNIVRGVGQALTDIFPMLKSENMTKALLDGTRRIKEVSEDILEMFGLYQEVAEEEDEVADEAKKIEKPIDKANDSVEELKDNMSDLGDEAERVNKNIDGVKTGLQRGMKGDDVKALQERLIALGFRLDKFGADGIFGPETQAAVKALQREIGVTETGVLDEATMAALNTEEALAKLQARAHKGLGSGDIGADVKDLQEDLNKYLDASEKLVVDGIFGPKTEARVKELQRELGVEQTGVWDEATRAALESGKMILFSVDKIRKGLKVGMVGDDVKSLQEQLIKTGYLTDQSVADGVYGPKTEAAVKALQRELGVEETGVWDKATMMAVNRSKRMQKANSEAAKAAAESSEIVEEAAETTEEAGEKASKAISHTTIPMMRFQNILKGWGAALKIVSKFAGSFVRIGGNILSMLEPLIDVGTRFGSVFGVMFRNLEKDLDKDDVYGKFVNSVTKAFGPFGKFIEGVAKSLHTFLDSYDEFLESTGQRNTFGSFFEFVGKRLKASKIFGPIVSFFGEAKKVINNIFALVGQLFTGKGGEGILKPETVKALNDFRDGVIHFFSLIKLLFTGSTGDDKELTEAENNILWFRDQIASVLGGIKDGAIGIWNTVTTFFGGLFSRIFSGGDGSSQNPEWVNTLKTTITDFVSNIKLFVVGLPESKAGLTETQKGILDFHKSVASILGGIRDEIVRIWNLIGPFFKQLFTGQGGEEVLSQDTIDKITAFRDGVANFFRKVRLLFTGSTGDDKELTEAENNILWFRGKVAEVVGTIKTGVINVWNAIIEFVKNVSTNGWKGVKTGLTKIITEIVSFFMELFGGIGSSVAKGIKDALGAYGWIIVWIGVIGLVIFGLVKLIKTIKNIHSIVTDFVGYLKGQVKQDKPKELSQKLLEFAAAIALIAASVYLISRLKPEEFWRAFGRLAAIVAIMAGFAILAGIFGKDKPGEAIERIGDGLFKFALAVGVLTAAIAVLSMFDEKMFETGFSRLISIVALISGFYILTTVLSKIGGRGDAFDGKSIMSLAKSILILVAVIKILSMMKYETLLNGLTKLVMIMGVLVAFTLLFGLVGRIGGGLRTDGIMKIAGALVILTGLVALISLIPMKTLAKGLIGMAAIMLLFIVFVAALNLVNRRAEAMNTTGLLALTGVILILAVVVGLLGMLPLNVLVKGILGLAAVMVIMTIFIKSVSKVASVGGKQLLKLIPIVLALGLIMAGFVIFAKQLSGVKFSQVGKALLSFAVVVIGLKSLTKTISKRGVDIKSSIGFLISALALAGVMVAFAYSMSLIKDVSTDKLLSFATGLSEMLLAFAIVGKIASGFGGGLGAFTGILAVAGAMAIVLAAFAGILQIPGVEDFLSGGAEKLGSIIGKFVGAMKSAEIEAFNKATEKMQSIDSVDPEKVDNATTAAQKVADFGAGLPRKDLITKAADFIFGSELSQFSKDMTNFGVGFNSFAKAINEVDDFEDIDTKTTSAIAIANSIKAFGESFEEKSIDTKIADAIFGSELSQFSKEMTDFGIGFNSYATAISNVTDFESLDTKTTSAIAIANSIKAFGESFEEKSIDTKIADAIFGSELSQFSKEMTDFGIGFKSYATIIQSIDNTEGLDDKTKSAIAISNSIKDFSDSFTDKSIEETIVDSLFGSELSQFSGDLVDFSSGFNSFAAIMGNITELEDPTSLANKTTSAVAIAASIKDFSDSFTDKSIEETIVDSLFGSELSQFSGDLVDFSSGFNSFAAIMGNITELKDPTSLANKTTSAVAIADSIRQFSENLQEKTTVESITDSIFGSELSQFDGDMTDFADSFNKYAETMGGITADKELVSTNTETAISIATDIADFLEKVSGMDIENKAVGIKGWFSDETNGDTVIRTVGALAQSISEAKDKFSGISEGTLVQDVQGAVKALSSITGLLIYLTGVNLGQNDLDVNYKDRISYVTGVLSQIGVSVQAFNSTIEGVDIASVATIMSSISDFLNFLSTNSGTEGLDSSIPDLSSIMTKITTALTTETAESEYSATGQKIFSSVMSGLSDGDTSLLTDFVTSIYTAVTDETGTFKTAGENFAIGLANGVYLKAYLAVEQAKVMAQQMVDAVKSIFKVASPSKVMNQVGRYFSIGLSKGVSKKSESAISEAGYMAQSMIDVVKTIFEVPAASKAMSQVGGYFSQGLEEGIVGNGENAIGKAGYIAQQMIDTVKSIFKIASPSKVMNQVGGYFSLGLGEGILDEAGPVIKAVANISKSTFESAKNAVSKVAEDVSDNVKEYLANGIADAGKDRGWFMNAWGWMYDRGLLTTGLREAYELTSAVTEDKIDWDQVKQDIDTGFRDVSNFVSGSAESLWATVSSTYESVSNSWFGNLVGNVFEALLPSDDTPAGTALRVFNSLKEELPSKMQELMKTLGEEVEEDSWEPINIDLVELIKMVDTSEGVDSLVETVTDAFELKVDDYQGIGQFIDDGLALGISLGRSAVTSMAEDVALSAFIAAKKALGVESPSKKFAWIGQMVGEGFSGGIGDSGELVSSTVKKISENVSVSAIDAVKAANDSIGRTFISLSHLLQEDIDVDPVIRPVVDLSDVDRARQVLSDNFWNAHAGIDVGRVSRNNANAVSNLVDRRGSSNTLGGSYHGGRSSVSMSDIRSDVDFQKAMVQKFDELGERMSNMKIVLDTGEFVGATSSAYDRQFGRMSGRRERGN